MNTFKRISIAVLVSTISVVPLFLILSIVTGSFTNQFLSFALLVALTIALIGVLFIGLPVHFILVWQGMLKPHHYAVAGFSIPAIFLIVAQPIPGGGVEAAMWQALYFGSFGAAVSLIFRYWAIDRKAT